MSSDVSEPYGAIRQALVAVTDGRISWVGPERNAPPELVASPVETVDLQGDWVTPGLIDAHTHLIFGGHRAHEFELRLGGATYEELALAGGGILATVNATRAAGEENLRASALRRLGGLIDHGTTTVEIKSGYGLDVETELRMLEVARGLAFQTGITVSTTLLAAHALPPEFTHDRAGYIDLVCEEMIPRAVAGGLADAVDVFCEAIAFTPDECTRVLEAGASVNLLLRVHADQRSDCGGAALAARLGARSADHLEYASDAGVTAMAAAGTAAVMLPGAFYFLRETRRPPIDAFRRAGVPLVVATDLNPGSSPVRSPLLALNMACVLLGMTPEEAVLGMTRHAASVLGFTDRGEIRVGARADLACWQVDRPGELCYWVGGNPCRGLFVDGRRIR
jgi:imidazolonepropionase